MSGRSRACASGQNNAAVPGSDGGLILAPRCRDDDRMTTTVSRALTDRCGSRLCDSAWKSGLSGHGCAEHT